MYKGMVRSYCAFLATLVWVAGASVASADERGSLNGELTKITGTAGFEAHHTYTPLGYCEGVSCIHTKPYWSLVIHSGSTKYELNEVFAEGSEKAPEFVKVGDVVLRPGTHLTGEAHVEVVSRDFSIISVLQHIELHMDSPFYGWTCRSLSESRPVYVDVQQESRNGTYGMRISGSTGDVDHPIRKLVSFANVRLFMDSNEIEFEGDTQSIQAELAIDQRSGRMNDLDSVLRVTNGLKMNVKLSCNRTR